MGKIQCESAEIVTEHIENEYLYDSMAVLKLTIDYPQLTPNKNCGFRKINGYYKRVASHFTRYVSTKLFKASVSDYQFAIRESYPFFPHEAMLTYTAAYNEGCILSIYYDRYEYMGGAHGITVRFSDSFNLNDGYPIELADLFPRKYNFKKVLLTEINKIIAAQIEDGSGAYFEDYGKLTAKNFNPKNFYLTPNGLCVYYQHYEIAPYASGIPEFILPYDKINAADSKCIYCPRY